MENKIQKAIGIIAFILIFASIVINPVIGERKNMLDIPGYYNPEKGYFGGYHVRDGEYVWWTIVWPTYRMPIYKTDLTNGRVIKSFDYQIKDDYVVAGHHGGLEWDGECFWYVDTDGNRRFKIENIPNDLPIAYIDPISPKIVALGEEVSFKGHGKDGDGSIREYEWASNIDGDLSNSNSFTTSSISLGKHTISFRVKDDEGAWSEKVSTSLDVKQAGSIFISSPKGAKVYLDGIYKGVAPLAMSTTEGSHSIKLIKFPYKYQSKTIVVLPDTISEVNAVSSLNFLVIAFLAFAVVAPSTAIYWRVSAKRREREREYERNKEKYRAKVEQWKAEGYKVDELEEMLK